MHVDIDGKEIKLYKFITRYELDPIQTKTGLSFSYILDIYKEQSDPRRYFPKVYRREFYQLTPSFSSKVREDQVVTDEELLVEDMLRSWSDNRFNSAEQVVEFVLQEIKEIFSCI